MNSKFAITCGASLICLAVSVGVAQATPFDYLAGKYVKINNSLGYGAGPGGEFYLDVSSQPDSGFDGGMDYVSFCLEKYEYIDTSNPFKIASVGDKVYGGGVDDDDVFGTTPGYDKVSDATQWVFYKYMYTNYFGAKSHALANDIQDIIWYLEDEITSLTGSALTLYTTKVGNQTAEELAKYNDYVTAINLENSSGGGAQSQLISTLVPEPTTMLLFGTGIAGLAGIARRKRD